ncbi:peptidase MA family metallohydrolase [Citrifermentans pelophilum]|nr:peptidase MA family metallohydrolase [Geoanaerobacter pelophilus]
MKKLSFLPFILILAFAATTVAGDPVSYAAKARQLIERGEYEQALDELKRASSLFPYEQSLKTNLALTYTEIAKRDMSAGRYAKAARYLAEARELLPENMELRLLRGVALYLDKDYQTAAGEFQEAGDGVEPLVYLGKISYDTGNLQGALSYWRRASEMEPGNSMLAALIAKAERELPVESRMDKGFSSMFDLSFDAELPPGLSAEVLDALESAYNSVGADLGLFPTARIPVLLYTKRDYSSVTAGPDWSGGLYDGKIRLPIGGITRMTPQLRAVIFHEFTHVLIAEITHGNIPTWLNEGLAEIEGRKEFVHPGRNPNLVDASHQLPLVTLSGPFTSMDGSQAGLAYQQSYSMAQFMVNRYGWYAVQNLLKNLGERASMEKAVARALSDWSLDLPGMLREWQESLPASGAKAE